MPYSLIFKRRPSLVEFIDYFFHNQVLLLLGVSVSAEHSILSQDLQNRFFLDELAIVMATPDYLYTMCGQMKTFIDSTCARHTEISDKELYFIVTSTVNSTQAMQRTMEEFRGFTSCIDNPKEKGSIYGTGVWNIGDTKKATP